VNELAIVKYVVQMRSGADIEVTKSEAEIIQEILTTITEHKFIRVSNQSLNTADITTVLTPEEATKAHMKKRGMWQCKFNNWHIRSERCHCGQTAKKQDRREVAYLPIPTGLKKKALEWLAEQNEFDREAVKFGAMRVGYHKPTGFYLAVLKDKDGTKCTKMEQFRALRMEQDRQDDISNANFKGIIEKGDQG